MGRRGYGATRKGGSAGARTTGGGARCSARIAHGWHLPPPRCTAEVHRRQRRSVVASDSMDPSHGSVGAMTSPGLQSASQWVLSCSIRARVRQNRDSGHARPHAATGSDDPTPAARRSGVEGWRRRMMPYADVPGSGSADRRSLGPQQVVSLKHTFACRNAWTRPRCSPNAHGTATRSSSKLGEPSQLSVALRTQRRFHPGLGGSVLQAVPGQ